MAGRPQVWLRPEAEFGLAWFMEGVGRLERFLLLSNGFRWFLLVSVGFYRFLSFFPKQRLRYRVLYNAS